MCRKFNASPFKFGAGFALGHLTSSLLSCFLNSSISRRSLLFSFSSILTLLRGSAEAKKQKDVPILKQFELFSWFCQSLIAVYCFCFSSILTLLSGSAAAKVQNVMKSSFLPKYEPIIVRISDLYSATLQGRNPHNFLFMFWEKQWLYIFILKFTDI